MRKISLVLVVPIFIVFLPLCAAAEGVDQIIINGKIVTVDSAFTIAEAIAITGERITAVGTNEEIQALASTDTKVWDVEGRTVIPGLIDNHVHYLRESPYWKHEVLFDGVRTRAEAVQILRDTVAARNPGEWIVVIGGFDIRQFTDSNEDFSRAELDSLAPDNPVFIQYGFEGGYGNKLALDQISAVTVIDPSNQTVDTATGYVFSGGHNGMPEIVRLALPEFDSDTWKRECLEVMNRDYNRAGITSLWNSGGIRYDNEYSQWAEEFTEENGDWAGVRMFHYINSTARNATTAEAMAEEILAHPGFEKGDYFRYQGFAESPYGPTYDLGEWDVTQDDLDAYQVLMEAVAKAGWQAMEHMIQDSKFDYMLDIWDEIDEQTDLEPLRWAIHHCDEMSQEQIERARDLDAFLAMHVGHMAVKNQTDLNKPPFRTAQESGVRWGLGTDAKIVSPYQPFVILYVAVTGKSVGGSDLNPDQTVSREDALIAFTRSNAWLFQMEDHLGTIEAGKYADIVVLDKDYLTCADEEIRTIESVLTFTGGTVGYSALDYATPLAPVSTVKNSALTLTKGIGNKLTYTLGNPGTVSLSVFNLKGQKIATPVQAFQLSGTHSVSLQNLSSGFYFVELKTETASLVQKINITR